MTGKRKWRSKLRGGGGKGMKWRGKERLSERNKKEMKGVNTCRSATITFATTKMTNVH